MSKRTDKKPRKQTKKEKVSLRSDYESLDLNTILRALCSRWWKEFIWRKEEVVIPDDDDADDADDDDAAERQRKRVRQHRWSGSSLR